MLLETIQTTHLSTPKKCLRWPPRPRAAPPASDLRPAPFGSCRPPSSSSSSSFFCAARPWTPMLPPLLLFPCLPGAPICTAGWRGTLTSAARPS
ncbi:hypothetical protein ACQJBY_070939 [Aegilops geniculata]